MMLNVMMAAALAGWTGVVSPKTEGWTFKASDAKDGMVYNPFEGTFPDKGGQLFSPEIALPQSAAEGGYYRFAFTAESEDRAFEGVNYYAADGKELPDRYDVIYPGKSKYDRVFYAMPGTAKVKLFFQGGKPFKVSDVTVEPVTWKEAADYADRVLAAIPKCDFSAPADAFALLPRTKAAMAGGKPWRVVMLGDSNSQDLYHSLFHALVKREFPKSNLRFLVSMRGSTGVAWYGDPEHPERIAEYVTGPKPDLLVIGGATNFRVQERPDEVGARLARVVKAAKAAGIEVLVNTPMPAMDTRLNPWTPNFNPDLTKDLGPMEFDVKKNFWCGQTYKPEVMRKVADEEKVAFWDFTCQGYEYIFRSGKPYMWFGRDDYHSGERGKQAWGRLYLEYWKRAK